MVTEARAESLLATFAEGAWVEDGRVEGIFIATKRGRQLVRAKAVVDCTADADIAADAGAPFLYGDPQDGHIQVCCFRWVMGDVDTERFERERPADEELAALFGQAVREGAIRPPDGLFGHDPAIFPFDAKSGTVRAEGWELREIDATDPVRPHQPVQHRHRRPHAQYQRRAQTAQIVAQVGKAFGDEGPLPGRGIGQFPVFRFDDVQRQDRPQTGRKGQRRMVGHPQVALEPDENIHGTRM